MSVNIVDFDSSLIPKQSANLWLSRGHTCRQYPARCTLQLPGCPSVLMQALSALHAASHLTAPDCRRNSVPGLGRDCQCHENLLAGGKQNAM